MYLGTTASGKKPGVCMCVTLFSRGFSDLPSSAHSQPYSAEYLFSELSCILSTFCGDVGMRALLSLQPTMILTTIEIRINGMGNRGCRVCTWIDSPLQHGNLQRLTHALPA